MKEKFIAVIVAVIFSVLLASSAAAEEINAFMATSPDNNAKIVKFIKEKIGIDVKQSFQSCGEVEAKMKAEAPNFTADMVLAAAEQTQKGRRCPLSISDLDIGIHGCRFFQSA